MTATDKPNGRSKRKVSIEVDDEPIDVRPALPEDVQTLLLRQAHAHLENTLKLVLTPANTMLAQALDENERLRAHIRKLEEAHWEAVAAREALQSEQLLRELAAREVQQSAERKDKALALAASNLPKLLAAVNPRANAVVQLMQSLSAEQRGLLLETDMLTNEQKATVRAVLVEPKPPEPESP